jgi:hypothetical protein
LERGAHRFLIGETATASDAVDTLLGFFQMHLTLKKETTHAPGMNSLQQQARMIF